MCIACRCISFFPFHYNVNIYHFKINVKSVTLLFTEFGPQCLLMWKIAKYFFFVTLVQNSFQKLRIPIYGYPKKTLRNTQYFSQIFCTFSVCKYFIQIILIRFHCRIICVKIGKNVWSWSRTRRNIKSCSYRWKEKQHHLKTSIEKA